MIEKSLKQVKTHLVLCRKREKVNQLYRYHLYQRCYLKNGKNMLQFVICIQKLHDFDFFLCSMLYIFKVVSHPVNTRRNSMVYLEYFGYLNLLA